jgi:hypothetical protein
VRSTIRSSQIRSRYSAAVDGSFRWELELSDGERGSRGGNFTLRCALTAGEARRYLTLPFVNSFPARITTTTELRQGQKDPLPAGWTPG